MKTKRPFVLLIASMFIIAILVSFLFLITVQKVEARFASDDTEATIQIQNELNSFLGDSLLFFDNEKVEKIIRKYPYFKLEAVSKDFPNVLKVQIVQRHAVYSYKGEDNKVYLIDKTGYVIDLLTIEEFKAKNIFTIDFGYENPDAISLSVGQMINAGDKGLFNSVLQMANSVNLTDCIEKIWVEGNTQTKNVIFYTRTGVQILIQSADIRGEEKIQTAFDSYHEAKDYFKTFDTIRVFVSDNDNTIQCVWSSMDKLVEGD